MYDLYGARELSVDQVHRLASEVLGIAFRRHYSDAVGDYYFHEDDDCELMIEPNAASDNDGAYHLEEDFPEYGTLFHAITEDGDDIRGKLESIDGLTFLRRELAGSADALRRRGPSYAAEKR
jgi:hypothetical protein